jgi:hypothetical protein
MQFDEWNTSSSDESICDFLGLLPDNDDQSSCSINENWSLFLECDTVSSSDNFLHSPY